MLYFIWKSLWTVEANSEPVYRISWKKFSFSCREKIIFFIFTKQLRNDAMIKYHTGGGCFAIRPN